MFPYETLQEMREIVPERGFVKKHSIAPYTVLEQFLLLMIK